MNCGKTYEKWKLMHMKLKKISQKDQLVKNVQNILTQIYLILCHFKLQKKCSITPGILKSLI